MIHRKLDSSAPGKEKKGNTSWVSCPYCSGWFHVSGLLLKQDGVNLYCPHCGKEFVLQEAAVLVEA